MKKALISLALAAALLSGTSAFAAKDPVISPEATPNHEPPKTTNVSPKTGDISTFAFAGAGLICIAGTVFCITRARHE